ncbi:hypothetical protein FDA94_28630 [Herbidospora galbida]|uniref:Uncharacterized protein n=1 Tax=Herbidospora galbida TaxID=2575442 RepID=A0A4U3M6N9_9ACTN|nr:hypothetical protein [Herbidospora galbida]TKK84598.1 hypothetical protein FDA94_28630 [Herbidospora galbida]
MNLVEQMVIGFSFVTGVFGGGIYVARPMVRHFWRWSQGSEAQRRRTVQAWVTAYALTWPLVAPILWGRVVIEHLVDELRPPGDEDDGVSIENVMFLRSALSCSQANIQAAYEELRRRGEEIDRLEKQLRARGSDIDRVIRKNELLSYRLLRSEEHNQYLRAKPKKVVDWGD